MQTLRIRPRYRTREIIPASALLQAHLYNATLMGAPHASTVIATLSRAVGDTLAFALDYDPARLDPQACYAVSVQIYLGGALIKSTQTVQQVDLHSDEAQVITLA